MGGVNILRFSNEGVVNGFTPEQLVFVDKTSCDRRTTNRGYGWAKAGERVSRMRNRTVALRTQTANRPFGLLGYPDPGL